METIWTFTVIIAGAFNPTPASVVEGFIGGHVRNTSVMFFETEEACNAARELMIASKPSIVQGLVDPEVTVDECEASKFKVQ